ncbi:MAG: metalloregulator ArsR/SmtB family transcription factor [Candidatus Aminicenantes bacterium]|nr:metalloregulator ArsR/SmtB family transcription factor [Candidatus Aminicenantes bacterium]
MKNYLRVFKALSDKSRLRIMKMLEVEPMCVCEITDVLNLAPSTVSKHLSLLHEAELIEDRKEARWVNYSLPGKSLIPFVSEMLKLLRRSLNDDPEVLADMEKAKKVDRVELCR